MAHNDDQRSIVSTLYVSQPVNLPPLTAQAAFDALWKTPGPPPANMPVVETASGCLRIRRSPAVSPPELEGPIRQLGAQLSSKRKLGRFAVAIELTPWSQHTCEIGLRPSGWRLPTGPGWRQRRYFSLAVDAAETMADHLESVVDGWIVGQMLGPSAALERLLST
jgi:hypothetical protein